MAVPLEVTDKIRTQQVDLAYIFYVIWLLFSVGAVIHEFLDSIRVSDLFFHSCTSVHCLNSLKIEIHLHYTYYLSCYAVENILRLCQKAEPINAY
jgi:hypothetical protein